MLIARKNGLMLSLPIINLLFEQSILSAICLVYYKSQLLLNMKYDSHLIKALNIEYSNMKVHMFWWYDLFMLMNMVKQY